MDELHLYNGGGDIKIKDNSNNKKIIISVPENISKELDSILKKYYNSYNK